MIKFIDYLTIEYFVSSRNLENLELECDPAQPDLFLIFPQFKKVQNILGEGGGDQENCGLSPLFVTFLNSDASLSSNWS